MEHAIGSPRAPLGSPRAPRTSDGQGIDVKSFCLGFRV